MTIIEEITDSRREFQDIEATERLSNGLLEQCERQYRVYPLTVLIRESIVVSRQTFVERLLL